MHKADYIQEEVKTFKDGVTDSLNSNTKLTDEAIRKSEKIDIELTEFRSLIVPLLKESIGPGADRGVRFRERRARP